MQPQPQQQAQAQAQAVPRRREVVVGGRRVKTIDVHAHCVVPKALALWVKHQALTRARSWDQRSRPRRLGEMDAQGIDVEAISINPFWYRAERDVAAEVIKVNNETLTAWCAAYPDRFLGFASVALQFPDLAVQQLEHAIKTLHMCGVAVGASVAGDEFSDPKFHPFWAKCEELGILIFIHPQSTPDLAPRLQGNGWLANTIGNPLDTTIALSHLIFEGTLDRFPGLKICSAHGGGYLPSYAPRSDHSLRVAPDMDTGVKLKKKPTEYLRTMYYDTLVFTSEALRHLAAEVGVEPAGDRHRSSDPVAGQGGRSHPQRARLYRRGAPGDAGRDRRQVARHRAIIDAAFGSRWPRHSYRRRGLHRRAPCRCSRTCKALAPRRDVWALR